MIKKYKISGLEITLCFNTKMGFEKENNQDSCFFDANDNVFAISICDGLGSAKKSAEGSNKASKLLVDLLIRNEFNKERLQSEWLENFKENPKEYNTTAKFIKITKDSIHFGGVGDGLIAIKSEHHTTTLSDKGEFSNQTACMFDINYLNAFTEMTLSLNDKVIMLICTDGFSEDIKDEGLDLLFKEAKNLFGIETKIKEFDESLIDLLNNWPNKTNGDDKTVAFIGVRKAK